jgi:quercetin dioxygenase-like cupin family protein
MGEHNSVSSITGLPNIKRYITDVNSKGQAIFSDAIDENLDMKELTLIPFGSKESARATVAYATDCFPTTLENQTDIKVYSEFTAKPPGVYVPNGSVLRYLDFPPGAKTPMHATKSLDYAIVIEGNVIAVLDDGQERTMSRGDVLVQRGTNHGWKNASSTEWARMVYVLLDSHAI